MGRKGRSPNYPRLPLREAIERVAKVHKVERTHKVDKEAVAKALNYGGLNGASITLIGTLKSYGLLQEDKEGVRVTEDAVTILRAPEGDPEKAEAIERAAFAPRVFSELRETWGDDPSELPSETTLQYRLEKRGFLEKAAAEVIRTYRDNLEFVSEETAEYNGADDPMDDPATEVTEVQPQQPTIAPRSAPPLVASGPVTVADQKPITETLQYRISGDSRVRLVFDGAVTREAIRKLRQYLELAEDDYPSRDELVEHVAVEQVVVEQPITIEPPDTE